MYNLMTFSVCSYCNHRPGQDIEHLQQPRRFFYAPLGVQFSSVWLLSHVWLFVTPWTAARKVSWPSPTPRVYSNSCPSSRWCHPTISSSVIPFSCPQSFPASGSFPMSQLFASGGQRTGVSASISVLSMNTQDWSPLRWTGWISLQPKGLSRVFSSITVQKHQFFCTQLSFLFALRFLYSPALTSIHDYLKSHSLD